MGGKACIAHKIFVVVEIFINAAPGLRLHNGNSEFGRQQYYWKIIII